MPAPVVVADIVRSGFVEGHHHGSVVALSADGTVDWSVGQVDRAILPRSCNKPLQAVGMLHAGLDLDGELLALASASHSGEPFHLDGVRRILADHGLGVDALQCPPDYPVDEQARIDWIRGGHGPESVAMNCSGKHAAMISTCVINGWPTDTYRDPAHPVQVAIRTAIDDLSGEPSRHLAVDGCGAPLFAISLVGLARAFGSFAAAQHGPQRAIADAYRAHPEYASGTRRDEVELHRAVPGLFCKAGAEGVYALGLPDGRGIAVKVCDGSARARAPLAAALLILLGHRHPALDRLAHEPVLGHGEPVGEIVATGL